MSKILATGIDIGSHCLRAVVLHTNGNKLFLEHHHETFSIEALFSDNYLFNYQEIVNKLQELKSVLPNLSANVAVSIPYNEVISQLISLDSNIQGDEIQLAVEQFLTVESPIPLQDLSIDFTKVESKNIRKSLTSQYYVCASSRKLVKDRVSALTDVGFSPILIESDFQSLMRILSFAEEVVRESNKSKEVLIHVEIARTLICYELQNGNHHILELPIGLTYSNELGSQAFYQQLTRLVSDEFSDSSPFSDTQYSFWLSGEVIQDFSNSSTESMRISRIPLPYFLAIPTQSDRIELATELAGYEKALGLAIGCVNWTIQS